MAALTALRLVAPSKSDVPQAAETRKAADKTGYAVFIPPLTLAVTAVLVATFLKVLGANNAIGISGTIALLVALLLFKTKPSYAGYRRNPPRRQCRRDRILPQVLAALGSLFTAAGVGDVIAHGVSAVIPTGNLFAATAVYCVSMALFTMIMGNGFAAFSVITVGIGIPFLIAQGANPVVIGALGLTGRLLRYPDDPDGRKLQYRAGGTARDKEQVCSHHVPDPGGPHHAGHSYFTHVFPGILNHVL